MAVRESGRREDEVASYSARTYAQGDIAVFQRQRYITVVRRGARAFVEPNHASIDRPSVEATAWVQVLEGRQLSKFIREHKVV
jgi:hypothetical protein